MLTQCQRIKTKNQKRKTKQKTQSNLSLYSLPEAKFITQTPHENYSWFPCHSSPSSRWTIPAKNNRTGQGERDAHTGGRHTAVEHVLRRTATPTGLVLCRPRTGRRSNQSPCFRGTRSWGKRSSMEGGVQTHTPATEGKDKWAGASAEQGQKQESRHGGPGAKGGGWRTRTGPPLCCPMATTANHRVWKGECFSFLFFLAKGQKNSVQHVVCFSQSI